jgi:uncharacterized protein (TIGR00369 family)
MQTFSLSLGAWTQKSRIFFETLRLDRITFCRKGSKSGRRNMVEESTTRSSQIAHPLIEKVLASKPPIAELIGFNIEDISDGRAVGSLQSGPQHANPMGTLHGGVLCDLADAAMGMAFASTLAQGESFTTMTLSINFFRPVWQTRLRAEARVVNRGKNVGYVECKVTDQDGKQVAQANSTCFVLRREHARER